MNNNKSLQHVKDSPHSTNNPVVEVSPTRHHHHHNNNNIDGDTIRFIIVICLTLSYFFVELVFGQIYNSLALVADSFHMLSDVIALVIGLVARIMQRRSRATKKLTFGLQRAEIIGTAVNTVMLLTLVFTIFLEAISRFIQRDCVKEPKLMMIVGGVGLLINFISMLVLSCGSSGSHGHSHGGGLSHRDQIRVSMTVNERDIQLNEESLSEEEEEDNLDFGDNDDDAEVSASGTTENAIMKKHPLQSDHEIVQISSTKPQHSHRHSSKKRGMALRGVLLHVMTDMFGSIIVVISAGIIQYAPNKDMVPDNYCKGDGAWKSFIDPSLSICLVILVSFSTFPLAYKAFKILFQSAPKEVNMTMLRNELKNVEKAHHIHDLHVWRLHTSVIIGTVHVHCKDANDFVDVTKEVRNIFHKYGVHSTTIQPEFGDDAEHFGTYCLLNCTDECGEIQKCCTYTPGSTLTTNKNENESNNIKNIKTSLNQ